jgi:alginate O-acetyltransferase complex protein AlgI
MVFTNGYFWLVVLSTVVVFWLLPRRFRDFFMVASFGVYIAWLDWQAAIAVMLFSCFAYFATQVLDGRLKWLTLIAGASVLLYLAYFKYLPPLLHPHAPPKISAGATNQPGQVMAAGNAQVLVPLGTSYFTFKIVHYVIECHRKHIQKHTLESFLAYMFFLPMFAAGPIERFDEFRKNRVDEFKSEHVWRGGTRIIYGLIKKFVIVDMFLGRVLARDADLKEMIPLFMPNYPIERVVAKLDHLHPLIAWQFVINTYIKWYVDFSAYTDIAIGLGLLYGIKLCENFEWPFLATNISDFWRRYHMSLSNWAQRYVYFPVLGSTRNATLALFATMIAIGLWHAGNLNFLVWGVYQASFLWLHLAWARYKRRRIGREDDENGKFTRAMQNKAIPVLGFVVTFFGVCASAVFPTTEDFGIKTGFRLGAALFGIHFNWN